jgi:hypothetical protein
MVEAKDAGFVYESFQNKTNQVIWSYKTNPRNESFENCVTKRIHKTNLLNTRGRNESTKRIFWTPEDETNPQNESFENQKICESKTKGFGRICLSYSTKDSWGFVGFIGFVESFENCVTKRIHETNLLKIAPQNESTKQIFWKMRHKTNPQNKSFENWQIESKRIHKTNLLKTDKSNQNKSTFLQISYTILASLGWTMSIQKISLMTN